MIKLNNNEFKKITQLVKLQDELSVFSVISGENPGDIYVNNADNPTVALIKTSECNLIAGSVDDEVFNSEIASELDFWEPLTPDSNEWLDKIPTVHKNSFVKKYKRRHYVLTKNEFIECKYTLGQGYILEKVNLSLLRKSTFENLEHVLEWAENFGDDENFEKYGSGYMIHNDKTIVSWSMSDCRFKKEIAIGIHTDDRYRKNGFAKIVVAATVKECFNKGYDKIHWLCVDSNKGSRAIAEKLGFKFVNHYYSFTSFPPIENLKDLSESEWHQWGEYLEAASKTEESLIWQCLFCYIKGNDVEKTIETMTIMTHKEIEIDYLRMRNWVDELQSYGMCSNFNKESWIDFCSENFRSKEAAI
ncbi:GNAT superfamily N-acetyltransferase [Clostridium punense]|uniref:GNAT superfamily N-acetyltransferase n=1 Tax=Clostridium punense TaxID=1054297 RepID=A0ABS4K626_9CLOT|nr:MULTISPECIES: GNAT family N-acetyltransferase [Clostridium]EQB87882.1 hypothetical protein M918_07015 [Clostridium sp. BL8]MBP2022740.1 GNAT superfamily N-acetyltransferase [Clostridium punense]